MTSENSIKRLVVGVIFFLSSTTTYVCQRVSSKTSGDVVTQEDGGSRCVVDQQQSRKKTLEQGRYKARKNKRSSCLVVEKHAQDVLNKSLMEDQIAQEVKKQKKGEKSKKSQQAHRVIQVEKTKNDHSEVKKSCYGNFAYGFIKYIVPSEFWYTTATSISNSTNSHDAYMSTVHTSMMPLIRAAIGFQFDDVPCFFNKKRKRMMRFGFEVSFAKKKNAYQGTYTKFSSGLGPNTVYQDVTRGTFMFVGSFDFVRSRSGQFGANLDLGLGLVGGSLKNLKLYDLNTYLFRGEYLPANKAAFGGFVGISLVRYFDQLDVDLDLSYRVVMNKVQYKNMVIRTIGVPGSETYPSLVANLSTPQYLAYKVGRGNSLRVYSNEVTLTMSKAF